MDNYAPSNQGYASAGALGSPVKPSRLEQSAQAFEKSLGEFLDLNQRLNNIADRILGPVPEAVSNDKQPPSPSATIGRVEYLNEGLAYALRRLRQSTERLEVLLRVHRCAVLARADGAASRRPHSDVAHARLFEIAHQGRPRGPG